MTYEDVDTRVAPRSLAIGDGDLPQSANAVLCASNFGTGDRR